MSEESCAATPCPGCGKPVVCGMKAGMSRCWCMESPRLLKVPTADSGASCYCPECLKEIAEAALREVQVGEKAGPEGG